MLTTSLEHTGNCRITGASPAHRCWARSAAFHWCAVALVCAAVAVTLCNTSFCFKWTFYHKNMETGFASAYELWMRWYSFILEKTIWSESSSTRHTYIGVFCRVTAFVIAFVYPFCYILLQCLMVKHRSELATQWATREAGHKARIELAVTVLSSRMFPQFGGNVDGLIRDVVM